MYEYFSFLYPRGLRHRLMDYFNYFAVKTRREFIVGAILFFSLGIALSFSFQYSKAVFNPNYIPTFIGFLLLFIISLVTIQSIIYSIISIMATNRGQFVELILPDALQLISANLRAGMTIDRALIQANRPEFGYFNKQFTIVGKEISTGTEVRDALKNMTRRVKSNKFAKAVDLIVMGMKSGGELSHLLSEVAQNLVQQKTVEEKIKSNVTSYLIFIGAAVGFAAPVLYGLSTVIVKVIVNTFSQIDVSSTASVNMPLVVSMDAAVAEFLPDFIKSYAMISLASLALMSSGLLGVIKRGSAKYGLNYIPALIGFGFLLFWAVSTGAGALFDGLI
ncbi:type II secretion system F family protein [Candidatus Woesearchaeota archaeon]|nr:type II secretion system F family protein [Candidatus Woesearchaeota archaeon]